MDAVSESQAGAGCPFAVGAFGYQNVDGTVREGSDADGQVFVPEENQGAIRKARVGRPTHPQGP